MDVVWRLPLHANVSELDLGGDMLAVRNFTMDLDDGGWYDLREFFISSVTQSRPAIHSRDPVAQAHELITFQWNEDWKTFRDTVTKMHKALLTQSQEDTPTPVGIMSVLGEPQERKRDTACEDMAHNISGFDKEQFSKLQKTVQQMPAFKRVAPGLIPVQHGAGA